MKRLELLYEEDIIELRYFEDESNRYRSWKIPKTIIEKLIPWWNDAKFKIKKFPVIKKGKCYEFRMDVSKYLYIKEFKYGTNYCEGSWDIPVVLIESLCDMKIEGLTEKII